MAETGKSEEAAAGGAGAGGAAGGAGGAGSGSGPMGKCSSEGCEKTGTMVCPTCKKLGINDSFFCSQECFKEFWPRHKGFHKLYKQMQAAKATNAATAGIK